MAAASSHPHNLRLVSALFFLSGATGLCYEVVWFKQFSHVWGTSSLAMAAVVGSFLCGLGVGAPLLGRWADRTPSPLFWYGVCEALIGLPAALIPYEMDLLVRASAALYPRLQDWPAATYAARFALTAFVVGPPCVLMGGTLPLLVKQLGLPPRETAGATGWLYAVNTLGAAFGCYLTGFHLLPALGLVRTNSAAVCTNLAVAGAAIALARRSVRRQAKSETDGLRQEKPGLDDAPRPVGASQLALAAALTGGAALMLQVAWARQLTLVLGGSTYAFSAMLCVVLVGIGLGSLAFHRYNRTAHDPFSSLLLVTAVLAVTTVAGTWLVPSLAILAGVVRPLRGARPVRLSSW